MPCHISHCSLTVLYLSPKLHLFLSVVSLSLSQLSWVSKTITQKLCSHLVLKRKFTSELIFCHRLLIFMSFPTFMTFWGLILFRLHLKNEDSKSGFSKRCNRRAILGFPKNLSKNLNIIRTFCTMEVFLWFMEPSMSKMHLTFFKISYVFSRRKKIMQVSNSTQMMTEMSFLGDLAL